jgi:hypothetical protein
VSLTQWIFFLQESTTPTLSAQEAAIVAAKALRQALSNSLVSSANAPIIATATSALLQLSAIFDAKTDASSPRVQDTPSVAAPPRVDPATELVALCTRLAISAINLQQGWANAVMHPITGKSMEYRQLTSDLATKAAWQLSAASKFGRLAQGVGGQIKGTDTIKFIWANELPDDRQPIYPRFVCMEQLHKEEKFCTQMTIGGNLIDYPGDVSIGTAEMETIKILLNGVVSTLGAKFCSADGTNFYLNMPMECHEFVCIPINLIPEEIVQAYCLHTLVDPKGFVLARIKKGMYRLLQAGMLANKLLKEQLGPHGYHACEHTPGLW